MKGGADEMARQIHFENLTLGMQAKLNTRYRIRDNHVHVSNGVNFLKSFYPHGSRTGFLGDAIITFHNRVR